MQNNILNRREEKKKFIEKNIINYQIVSIKANIPGANKNINIAYYLVMYFAKRIERLKPISKFIFDNEDGPSIIYFFEKNISLKEKTIQIEETDSLGRFIDIDVYFDSVTSVSRNSLRKCYLCDDPAFVCGRLKKHSTTELINYIKNETIKQINDIILKETKESMLQELDLHPKFGLVTPFTNGSHTDMDYDLMKKAIDVIVPNLPKYFFIGFNSNNIDDVFLNLRKIGISIENEMFTKTKGINAYKGLIFGIGIILGAIGYKTSRFSKYSIFDIAKMITTNLTLELQSGSETFGKIAYQKYGITGARGEAENGYSTVVKILDKYREINKSNLINILMDLISVADDTVLLKRCKSINKYNSVKEMFKNCIDIEKLNEYCICNNLSFGGSADLLIITLFIYRIKEYINIGGE